MSLVDVVTAWLPDRTMVGEIATAAVRARLDLDLETFIDPAAQKPPTAACVNLQPGNGWRYQIVVTRIGGLVYDGQPLWFPSALLLALPEFNRCLVLDSNASIHTPAYVDEKLRLGASQSAVVAAFATLLTATMTPSGPETGKGSGK